MVKKCEIQGFRWMYMVKKWEIRWFRWIYMVKKWEIRGLNGFLATLYIFPRTSPCTSCPRNNWAPWSLHRRWQWIPPVLGSKACWKREGDSSWWINIMVI
jgi:hypothetical protein